MAAWNMGHSAQYGIPQCGIFTPASSTISEPCSAWLRIAGPGGPFPKMRSKMRKNSFVRPFGMAFVFTLALAGTAQAQNVGRLVGNPKSPIAQAVTVPPGYTTYYVSGTPGTQGDTNAQTIVSLTKIKETLTTLGLTFG